MAESLGRRCPPNRRRARVAAPIEQHEIEIALLYLAVFVVVAAEEVGDRAVETNRAGPGWVSIRAFCVRTTSAFMVVV